MISNWQTLPSMIYIIKDEVAGYQKDAAKEIELYLGGFVASLAAVYTKLVLLQVAADKRELSLSALPEVLASSIILESHISYAGWSELSAKVLFLLSAALSAIIGVGRLINWSKLRAVHKLRLKYGKISETPEEYEKNIGDQQRVIDAYNESIKSNPITSQAMGSAAKLTTLGGTMLLIAKFLLELLHL